MYALELHSKCFRYVMRCLEVVLKWATGLGLIETACLWLWKGYFVPRKYRLHNIQYC